MEHPATMRSIESLTRTAQNALNVASSYAAEFLAAYENRTKAYRERTEQIGRFVDNEVAPLTMVPNIGLSAPVDGDE